MNEFSSPGFVPDSSWIGLYYDKSISPNPPGDGSSGTKWLWEDRRPLSYSKWANGFPVDSESQKGCGRIRNTGEWEEASSCTVNSPYICKLESDFNPGDHPDPGEDICDPNWWAYGGYCYFFDTGWETFDDAQDKCKKLQGANLASIHSDDERRFIASQDRGDQWIGLRRSGDGGFGTWTDGSPLDYTSWQAGEPNNGGSSGITEDCVVTNGQGFWNDVGCTNYNSYMCRKPAEHSFCKIEVGSRKDCGWEGIQEYECRDFGCCWTPVPDGKDGNWCYHPENNVECLNAGGTCVHSGQTSRCNRGTKPELCSNGGSDGSDQVWNHISEH